MKQLLKTLSFGERYVIASLFYLGLSMVIYSQLPEIPQTFAQATIECTHEVTIQDENGSHGETRSGCPDGQQCCGGVCISNTTCCSLSCPYYTDENGNQVQETCCPTTNVCQRCCDAE